MAATGTYSREKMALPSEPFESERLVFRPMTVADEPSLWEMVSSADVMQYIPLDVQTDRAATMARHRDEFAKGERYKFFFAVYWKNPTETQSSDMIGLEIMRPFEDGTGMEIGYWFLPDVWGQGLATEATRAVAAHCPAKMGFAKADIRALVLVGNHASRRVLEKSGLVVVGTDKEDDHEVWLLEMQV